MATTLSPLRFKLNPYQHVFLLSVFFPLTTAFFYKLVIKTDQHFYQYLATLFFGLISLYSLLALLPGFNYLCITPSGLILKRFGPKVMLPWEQIEDIYIYSDALERARALGVFVKDRNEAIIFNSINDLALPSFHAFLKALRQQAIAKADLSVQNIQHLFRQAQQDERAELAKVTRLLKTRPLADKQGSLQIRNFILPILIYFCLLIGLGGFYFIQSPSNSFTVPAIIHLLAHNPIFRWLYPFLLLGLGFSFRKLVIMDTQTKKVYQANWILGRILRLRFVLDSVENVSIVNVGLAQSSQYIVMLRNESYGVYCQQFFSYFAARRAAKRLAKAFHLAYDNGYTVYDTKPWRLFSRVFDYVTLFIVMLPLVFLLGYYLLTLR